MNADRLLALFERISEAPDAIPRLRRFILDLAVRGKLVEQDPEDEPAEEQLERIIEAKILLGRKERTTNRKRSESSDESLDFPLPAQWATAPLADLATVLNGRAYKQSELLDTGTPVLRVGNLFTSNKWYYSDLKLEEDKYCNDGDLIFAWSASFGPFIWNGGRAIYHYHIWKLPLHSPADLSRDYLYLYLLNKTDEIKASGHGISMVHMTKEKMERLEVPLPPLAEQHRIVAKVDELMVLCDQLEAARQERRQGQQRLVAASLQRLNQPAEDPESFRQQAGFALEVLPRLTSTPAQIKQLRQAILNLAVRGKLVEQDPEDEPASLLLAQKDKDQRPKHGDLERVRQQENGLSRVDAVSLPTAWQCIAMKEVCVLVTSGSRGWAEFYSDDGPGFIRAQNIRFGNLKLEDLAHVAPPRNSEGQRTKVQVGDLLIVITGAGVTNPALLDCDLGEAYVSQHVALVRPVNATLSRWLLLCLMAEDGGRGELLECAYGSGKPGLNLTNLRELSIPLPPLAEQHRIVAKVDELMALCAQLEQQLNAGEQLSRKLLEAVLQEALVEPEKALGVAYA
jgi:type I restriction enzyme, S subunit